jgi:hypothetical protein
MPKFIQILNRLPGSHLIVNHHGVKRTTTQFATDDHSRNSFPGKLAEHVAIKVEWISNCDDAFYPPTEQHVCTKMKLSTIILKVGDQWKISNGPQIGFDASENLRAIRIGYVENDHTDGVTTLAPQ